MSTRSRPLTGRTTLTLRTLSRCFAGCWSRARLFSFCSLALRMRRANIIVSHSNRSPLGLASRRRLSHFKGHRTGTWFIILVPTRSQGPFSVPSLPYMQNTGEISVSVVTTSGKKRDSILSFTDQLSIPSISLPSDLKPDLKIEEYSPSDSTASSSKESLEFGQQGALHQLVTLPALPSASVPPHHADSTNPTVRPYSYSGDAANAV